MLQQGFLKIVMRGLVAPIVLGIVCSDLAGQTYDLAEDWSGSQNPNGAWSYTAGNLPIASHQPAWAPWAFSGDQPA